MIIKYLADHTQVSEQLTIFRGDDVELELTIQNDDGTAVNITGCTIAFSAQQQDETAIVLSAETSVHTVPLEGKTVLTIPHSQTEAATPGIYIGDVRMRDTAGKYTTFGLIRVRIRPNISRMGG